jgi:hypothetical protein
VHDDPCIRGINIIDDILVDFDERGGDSSVEVLSNVTDMAFGEGMDQLTDILPSVLIASRASVDICLSSG